MKILSILVAAGSVAIAHAQSQDDALIEAAVSSFDRHAIVHHDIDRAGDHWSRGREYKTCAATDGFSFLPFLGSDAPKNYPVTFRLSSVARDGEPLPLNGSARVSRVDERIVLDRGAVQVLYDFAPEGVEQSFALDVPAGSGDLVLTLDVETELAVERSGGGFRFSNERGGVTYGAAIAFDAAGRTADVPAEWTGDGIALRVPSAFLAEAAGPIVVDPLLSPFSAHAHSDDLRDPDAAYDAVRARYCVVFEEHFSVVDQDVYSVFVDGVTGNPSDGQYVELGSTYWRRPRIAHRAPTQEFLIIAEAASVTASGRQDIVARTRAAAGGLGTPYVLKSGTAAYDARRADIGGQNTSSATPLFCVAYNRHVAGPRQTWAIMVGPNGLQVGPELPLQTNPTVDSGPPSVSATTGIPTGEQRFCLAWAAYEANSDGVKIQSIEIPIDLTGSIVPFDVTPYVPGAEYDDVHVSSLSGVRHHLSNEPHYLIAYDGAASTTTDAMVAICHGPQVGRIISLPRREHSEDTSYQRNLRIATTPNEFVLGYAEQNELYVTIVQPLDGEVGITERRLTVPGTHVGINGLCAASHLSGGGADPSAAFFWSQLNGSTRDIHGAFADVDTTRRAAGSQFCYGTSNGTGDRSFIQLTGSRLPHAPHVLRVEALPTSSFGYFLASRVVGLVPNAGGSPGTLCLGGSIGRFGVFNSGPNGAHEHTLDPQAIQQPNGTVNALAGDRWAFQCWHRDSVGGVATSNFTNGVTVLFL